MSDKPCKHEVVNRSVDGNHYCEDCGAEFFHYAPSMPTLRDQFAMAAMVADAVSSGYNAAAYIAQGKTFDGKIPGPEEHAAEYFKTADEMMKTRIA
jgi:hypothetical protein